MVVQPYEAFQARARIDHTSFSWYFDNFNLAGAANSAVAQDVAIVFLLSDSGEGYITVDGNAGDRYASLSAGFSLHPNKIVPVAQEKSHGMAKW
jgi:hypothetical protein